MTRIMLVAHAPLASALKDVAVHVAFDAAQRLEAMDVRSDEDPAGVELRLQNALGHDEALILCDVPGATPFNGARRLARSRDGLRVLVGLNAPMIWRVLWSTDQSLGALARLAAERGINGVDPEPDLAGHE